MGISAGDGWEGKKKGSEREGEGDGYLAVIQSIDELICHFQDLRFYAARKENDNAELFRSLSRFTETSF